MTASRIIFPLDFPTLDAARGQASTLRGAIGMVKVGFELFIEAGPAALTIGPLAGVPTFLDLKLHDIPETVERAVARASALGARMLTVHASGGRTMLRRAVGRAERERAGLEIVAITVLTSLDASDLADIGFADSPVNQACRLARLAFDEGVRAFVCSPGELVAIRNALGPDITLVTPGVRPTRGAGGDDQKRVATPARAVADGADWLVVGRPIRDAADPVAAARAIDREVRQAMADRQPAGA